MRTWVAATCWQLLIALQPPRDDCCLMRYSALEDGREDIPVIADVDIPLVMSSQLKELSKSIREAAKVSWDLRREGAVGDEGAPLPAEVLSAQEPFRAAGTNYASQQTRTQEKLWLPRKRPLNRHCIRSTTS